MLDAEGVPAAASETVVTTDRPGNHWLAEVACRPGGGFVIAGARSGPVEDMGFEVFFRKYDAAGNADPTPATWSWTIEAPPTGERQEKASGRPASASSVEGNPDNPDLVSGKAVDGSASTRWSSEKGPLAFPATDQWWQVDLGSARKVDTVEVDWEAAYASRYRILTSLDGVSFTAAADETATAAGKRAWDLAEDRLVKALLLTIGRGATVEEFERLRTASSTAKAGLRVVAVESEPEE